MFCGNCGSEIKDGLEICSKCGKSPDGTVVNKFKTGGYPLINLSAKLYTLFFEISLWLILIIGIVGGGVIGNLIDDRVNGILPGIIIGFLIAFVLMIQIGGLTSVFLKINENAEKIEKSVKKIR
jgi:hypothetical protein